MVQKSLYLFVIVLTVRFIQPWLRVLVTLHLTEIIVFFMKNEKVFCDARMSLLVCHKEGSCEKR